MAILSAIFICLFSLSYGSSAVSHQYSSFTEILLPRTVVSPQSVTLDPWGGGPYAAVADGRILIWKGPHVGFVDFAYTSPNRNKQCCDGTNDPNLGPVCGRPFGFSFNKETQKLYIVDAFLGLFVVGREGGLATQLANSADGVPFRFLSGVDVDQKTGHVYFIDASDTFDLRNVLQPNFIPVANGRLMKYEPRAKKVTVLMKGLNWPVGPAISLNGSFVVVPELWGQRILKYLLVGEKAFTSEILFNLTGQPSAIKRTPRGDFSVAVNYLNIKPGQMITPVGLRFTGFGNVVQKMSLDAQYLNLFVTLFQEQNEAFYVGGLGVNFIGIYQHQNKDILSNLRATI